MAVTVDAVTPASTGEVLAEAARRRTFAIISHPDAGKTTLTEKFLLYAGAVQRAGAVKAREGRRAATSDWMELEQQRGISISSTVLQFPYRDHVVNLLDTPGHKDFSEDTYRVLAGVDAVVMVLDAAKGIEAQTLKLFEVCRSRKPAGAHVPQQVRPPRPRAARAARRDRAPDRPPPDAGHVAGRHRRRPPRRRSIASTAAGTSGSPAPPAAPRSRRRRSSRTDQAAAEEGPAWQAALDEISLLDAVGADVDLESFLAGDSTPVFVGSALTNFGVRMILDAVVDLAPSPSPKADVDGDLRPLEAGFSAFVFKVQANMDPSHRDRLAFARICSGKFERGMTVTCDRTGRELTTKYATTAFGPDRETVEEAYPGRRRRPRQRHRPAARRHDPRRRAGHVPADPTVLARGLRHRPPARHRTGQAVPQGTRTARRGGRRAGAARPRPRHQPGARRRRRPAVRGLRPPARAASSTRRPRSCQARYQAIRRTDQRVERRGCATSAASAS